MESATWGLIVAAVLHDLFDDNLDKDKNFLHNQEKTFEKRFRRDCIKLIDAFRKLENPFQEQPLIGLVVKTVVPPYSVEFIRTAYAIEDW